MKPKVILLTIVGTLIVLIGLIVAAVWLLPLFMNVRLESGPKAPAFGPRGLSSGQVPGGLAAVSSDGKALPVDAINQLPENIATQMIGSMKISLALSPYPPVGFQETNFDLTLTDEQGQAITDATIQFDLTMPGMPMPPNSFTAQHTGNGQYHATGRFTMRGLWGIEVMIKRGGEKKSAFFYVEL